jgi:uncharacterized protein
MWKQGERYRMSTEVLETYIEKYIQSQPGKTVSFAWQGGEPTLMGTDFFKKVTALQKKHAQGKHIENAIQTNGTLLNDDWAKFFKDHGFLVGLSIDGPKAIHDAYRVQKNGKGSWEQVMQGLDFLVKHGVDWNSLTCVHRQNAEKPLEIYRFLRGIGSKYMQFIPVVERKPDAHARQASLTHAAPLPLNEDSNHDSPVSSWSVKPDQYGRFLIAIFDRWITKDVGRIFIQINDVTLGTWLNRPGGLCIFSETCGNALAMEHDGSVYSCDHYVYPEYRIGNIKEYTFHEIINNPSQRTFGQNKKTLLPRQCMECKVRRLCNGGCPKQRFINDKYGNPGLNYLCDGYYHYFTHTAPAMQRMRDLIQSGGTAADIMKHRNQPIKT